MQDGDLLYQVNRDDLAFFKRLSVKRKYDKDREHMADTMSGMLKYTRTSKYSHLNQNVRPKTTHDLLKKLDKSSVDSDDKKLIVQ